MRNPLPICFRAGAPEPACTNCGVQEQQRTNYLFGTSAPLVLLWALEESCYKLSAGRMDGERVANVKSASLLL